MVDKERQEYRRTLRSAQDELENIYRGDYGFKLVRFMIFRIGRVLGKYDKREWRRNESRSYYSRPDVTKLLKRPSQETINNNRPKTLLDKAQG